MGVDLTGKLSGFKISTEDFKDGDCSVEIGCIGKGNHRLLRFDMIRDLPLEERYKTFMSQIWTASLWLLMVYPMGCTL